MVHIRRQRLSEDVRYHIAIRSHLAHLNSAMCNVLSQLQVATIDVARSLAGAALLGQLDML
eukprot:6171970-Pleurochrysis_carterae.AAC.1